MMRWHTGPGLCAWLATAAIGASPARAQDWFADVGFNQSVTTLEPLSSPRGFSVNVGALDLWGPLGLQATYRRVAESGEEIAQHCSLAACTPGPFDHSLAMHTWGLGATYDFRNPTGVFLTLAVGATASSEFERLVHLGTGERTTFDASGTELGLGASAHLRLRPLVADIRPIIALRYDRIWAADCLADAACWPDRDVFGFTAGFGWVVRSPERPRD